MEYIKLQTGCLLVVLYVIFNYYVELCKTERKRITLFGALLILSVVCLVFDGLTAYFVNSYAMIGTYLNLISHMIFLISLDAFIFLLFVYMLYATDGLPKSAGMKMLVYLPFVLNVILVVVNIGSLEYRNGEISNYSMGTSAYTCFIMAAIYIVMSIVVFFRRWNYIESHKRISIFTYLLMLSCVTAWQMVYPESLVSSIAVTIIILGVYLNQENPTIDRLNDYRSEMVMGFATLVENKDDSTGGHINRTTMYVKLLAEELKRRGIYKNELTKDYVNSLILAAPMHDVGKIVVPDVILQKPDKLTDEEFEVMKKHTTSGGRIIRETFGHMENAQYSDIAYDMAMCHHEKWNGKGYPKGLKRKEIPLSARIMAIADVFDAVAEKRCYRDAMPLQKCFDIISDGSGQDFDPMIAEVFLDMRDEVIKIHEKNKGVSRIG